MTPTYSFTRWWFSPVAPRKSATQSRLNRTSTARSRVAAMTTNRFWLK
ncbi:Uncharacterised protein [Flavonifractor plautii]|uniref:Uncharacterized protein n=1 Tax=Flavonifractor plautii TaxID=292800 RepID=A0A174RA85_FLAPL|nr:Uncharacterised protein [Flavonifractor plautii]